MTILQLIRHFPLNIITPVLLYPTTIQSILVQYPYDTSWCRLSGIVFFFCCPCMHGIKTGFIIVIHCVQCVVRFQVSNTGQRVRLTQILCSAPHSPFRKFCAVDFASRRFCATNFAFDFTLQTPLRKFCAWNALFVIWLLNRNQSRTHYTVHIKPITVGGRPVSRDKQRYRSWY
jgi:hypothetical protein